MNGWAYKLRCDGVIDGGKRKVLRNRKMKQKMEGKKDAEKKDAEKDGEKASRRRDDRAVFATRTNCGWKLQINRFTDGVQR